jgi:SAM-dependent methyltransferase
VLEIKSQNGYYFRYRNRYRRFSYFNDQTNATKIIGLDISAGMLEVGVKKIAEKKLSNTIEMVLGDSENMPLKIIILTQ